ncbi:Hypothetical predicted protein [Mytilus galloprovincialis]|uniref:Uncharacterized protein n=1 Tax=Mytilus galloprovincialis TaxID=29158 RepID=A0A8B6HLS1_MYTGA|nr:Hypothetical predicted protein [Mytilus galloprovincialis]
MARRIASYMTDHNLQRAERIRKVRRERGKKRAMFVANPYNFTNATLDGTKAESVKSTKEEKGVKGLGRDINILYEITSTTVEELERIINGHLRKWLEVPRSFTTVGLYSRTAKVQFPLTSIVEKLSKTRLVMTLKESRDDKVRTAGVQVKTRRKWPKQFQR